MAEYTGTQSILNAALGEYQKRGFRLVENGDHTLELYYKDNLVDVFSQTGATIRALRDACQAHLDSNPELNSAG